MTGLLKGPLLASVLAISTAALAPRELAAEATPDTAQLRTTLAAAFGADFEIVRTELSDGLRERGGTFWLVYARPRRSGDFQLRYRYEYRDLTHPEDPLFTHVEHTSYIRVGEQGCRRSLGRDACLGDTVILPFVADNAGHTFTLTWRPPSTSAASAEPAPGPSETVSNPVAAHLRYLGSQSYEMLNRNGGGNTIHTATFEAVAPGRFNLTLSATASPAGSVPVIIVPRDQPVTVLLANETVVRSNAKDGFSSHSGNQYLTTLLLLQPGDRITLRRGGHSAMGDAAPVIIRFPFHLDTDERFNAWIAENLPVEPSASVP